MKKVFLQKLLLLSSAFVLMMSSALAQNIVLDDFESYNSKSDLSVNWGAIGFSTLDYTVVIDTAGAPVGTRYFEYVYSGNAQTTWGGAIQYKKLTTSPVNLSGAQAIQFYLKGDGTANVIYVRLGSGEEFWASHRIALTDTNWHPVVIPIAVSATNGFTNGSKTDADLQADLANITDFRVFIDRPAIDNISYKIRFDAFTAAMNPIPEGILIDDFETYNSIPELRAAWGFFGFSTADYNPLRDAANAPVGFSYLDYKYRADASTTWGSAFRTLSFNKDLSAVKSGIQFYLKGDGTDNHFYLRLDNGLEMFASAAIPLKDTSWHLVKINFTIDTLNGLRYVGNNPDNGPDYSLDPGTTEQLRTHLANITGMRFVLDRPVKDDVVHVTAFDAIYAVDQYTDGTVVPVELTSFSASRSGSSVVLNWSTATETNNKGFEVQRSSDSKWEAIAFIDGKGTVTSRSAYSFTDNNVSGSVSYRLKQIDFDGSYSYSSVINVAGQNSMKYELAQNYPNPFNPSTKIKYQIMAKDFVSLKIYNVLGKEVASLVSEVQNPGTYEAVFNAQNLSSGLYFYTLKTGSYNVTKKMTLIK